MGWYYCYPCWQGIDEVTPLRGVNSPLFFNTLRKKWTPLKLSNNSQILLLLLYQLVFQLFSCTLTTLLSKQQLQLYVMMSTNLWDLQHIRLLSFLWLSAFCFLPTNSHAITEGEAWELCTTALATINPNGGPPFCAHASNPLNYQIQAFVPVSPIPVRSWPYQQSCEDLFPDPFGLNLSPESAAIDAPVCFDSCEFTESGPIDVCISDTCLVNFQATGNACTVSEGPPVSDDTQCDAATDGLCEIDGEPNYCIETQAGQQICVPATDEPYCESPEGSADTLCSGSPPPEPPDSADPDNDGPEGTDDIEETDNSTNPPTVTNIDINYYAGDSGGSDPAPPPMDTPDPSNNDNGSGGGSDDDNDDDPDGPPDNGGGGGDGQGDCDPATQDCSGNDGTGGGTGGDGDGGGQCDPSLQNCDDGTFCDPLTTDCEEEEEQGSGNSSDDCSIPPSCSGDPVQCAILQQVWQSGCQNPFGEDDGSADSELAALDAYSSQNPADSSNQQNVDVSGQIDGSGFVSGSCPAPITVPVLDSQVTFEFNLLCTAAEWVGFIIVAISTFVAYRIIASAF